MLQAENSIVQLEIMNAKTVSIVVLAILVVVVVVAAVYSLDNGSEQSSDTDKTSSNASFIRYEDVKPRYTTGL